MVRTSPGWAPKGGRQYVSPTIASMRRLRDGRKLRQVAALLAVFVAATGCTAEDWLRLGQPNPITEQGRRMLNLWQGSWIAAWAVGLLVWGLILWAVTFHRKKSEELPPQVRYNLPIEVLYMAIPFIMVSVLFFFTIRDESVINRVSPDPDLAVDVVAFQWSWQFTYPQHDVTIEGETGEKPTLVLPRGESVRFHLTSPDVVHSMWVPAFLFKRDAIPGHPNTFEVTPEKEGTYAGRCSELCGTFHSQMLFTVRVVSPAEFDRFIERQQQRAAGSEQP